MEHKSVIHQDRHRKIISHLETEQFYGILETHFEGGRIVRIKKHETLLDEDVNRLTLN